MMSMVKNISMRSLFAALSFINWRRAFMIRYQINAKGNRMWLKIKRAA
jgi:hypothetical protein